MIKRGTIYWADLGEPQGSKPARRRPVLVVQADAYNNSQIRTVLAAVVTSNTALAAVPGNVFVPASASGLPKDLVVNVSALITLDRDDVDDAAGDVPRYLMDDIDRGLRQVLDL